jgi:hypothetical protein
MGSTRCSQKFAQAVWYVAPAVIACEVLLVLRRQSAQGLSPSAPAIEVSA